MHLQENTLFDVNVTYAVHYPLHHVKLQTAWTWIRTDKTSSLLWVQSSRLFGTDGIPEEFFKKS